MKQLITIITLIFFVGLTNKTIAQHNTQLQATGHYYIAITAKYSVKPTGVESSIQMDIGEDVYHPFNGQMRNIDNKMVHIQIKEFNRVFQNELDLLGYLKSQGWELVSTNKLTVLKLDYMRYLLYKKE